MDNMNMGNMFDKIKELQTKMQEAQENLVNITETAEAGGGMVKATVNGKKQVISVEIDKDIIKPEDQEMIQDLTVAAVNKALENVDGKAKEELRKSTSGMMPNIPGMDLTNFM